MPMTSEPPRPLSHHDHADDLWRAMPTTSQPPSTLSLSLSSLVSFSRLLLSPLVSLARARASLSSLSLLSPVSLSLLSLSLSLVSPSLLSPVSFPLSPLFFLALSSLLSLSALGQARRSSSLAGRAPARLA